MKKIYVAGRYSAGNIIEGLQNIGKGEAVCARLFREGFAVFCPWADSTYCKLLWMDDLRKESFYQASIAWLEVSDAVLVISGEGDGGGVDAEIKIAGELGIPVFRRVFDLIKWDGVKL